MNRTATDDVFLSVVIPAYDEAARIGGTVQRVCAYLDQTGWSWELIVVLDGGRPGAHDAIAAAAAGRGNVRVLDNGANRGKGFSVRRGIGDARGRYRLFVDADLSLPIESAAAFVDALEGGADVAIGSRTVAGASVDGEGASARQAIGRVFNLLVRASAVSGIRDTQCGLKAFRREAAERIFGVASIDRFGFDVEVLRLAQRFGYRIVEVPVACMYHGSSSVRRVRDAASMCFDILRVRWYEATGRYK
jgi:dolichyl-phosphate beta-glucosyltransferase